LLHERLIRETEHHRQGLIATSNPGLNCCPLINDDENKVFGITFRTPPSDSTGIAHILEHSVLCGSANIR